MKKKERLKRLSKIMSSGPPLSDLEIAEALKENLRLGWLIETEPGIYYLTEKGRQRVAFLIADPSDGVEQ